MNNFPILQLFMHIEKVKDEAISYTGCFFEKKSEVLLKKCFRMAPETFKMFPFLTFFKQTWSVSKD